MSKKSKEVEDGKPKNRIHVEEVEEVEYVGVGVGVGVGVCVGVVVGVCVGVCVGVVVGVGVGVCV